MEAIKTTNLTKYYGKTRGIINLDLTINKGEFFGFIGPNGAGKSTTIRTLLGLIAPSGGSAQIFGMDIVKGKESILQRVGYLPSEAVFYSGMKVNDIVKLSADLRKKDCKNEANLLCERLQLDVNRRVEELSFGNRKKVAIVCALQHMPELLILDEPTGGLDPLMQKEFFDILHERNKKSGLEQFSYSAMSYRKFNATTTAFGMDRLNFGTLVGFYAIECGNVLGLGGAFYAALCAVGILSKEEKERTAEFLLTHPVSRIRIITEKLIAVLIQITAMSLTVYALSVGSIAIIGEKIPWKEINLLHFAYYLLQIEMAGICFGISSFLHKGSVGVGLGIAAMMYFLNLIANIAEVAEFLKYITPFGYCEGADIVSNGSLNGTMVAIGIAIGIGGIVIAYLKYARKDIR